MGSTLFAWHRRAVLGGMLAAILVRPARSVAVAEDDLIGAATYYVTNGEETLLEVARQRGLGILEISAANPGVDVWVPGIERLITLPTAHLVPNARRQGIVINIAELRLFWWRPDGAVETHPIGVGRDGLETPTGETRIVRKQAQPVWYPTEGKRRDNPDLPAMVPPGPDNPLGEYALYLGWPTYLIHGTNKPYGVGRRLSRGCIRMYPEDIAALFSKIAIGTPVTVVDQPVKLGWHAGELYVEAHPTLAQLTELEDRQAFTLEPAPDMTAQVLQMAGDQAGRVDWPTLNAELTARRGLPVPITRPVATAQADGVARGPNASVGPARLPSPPDGDAATAPRGAIDGIY